MRTCRNVTGLREMLPLWKEVGSVTASKQPTGGVACVRTCHNGIELRKFLPLWNLDGQEIGFGHHFVRLSHHSNCRMNQKQTYNSGSNSWKSLSVR